MVRKSDRDDDLAREIRAHLELEAEERVARGASTEEARFAARRAFGNVARVREDARAVWIPAWVEQAAQDLRYGARTLTRTPSFTLTALLILIVGIGLNLAFFQLLNVTALRPPAVDDPDTLVRFDRVARTFMSNAMPYPATQFIRRHNDMLAAVLTWSGSESDVVWGDDTTDRLRAAYVSANWFRELGYGAAAGRVFVEALDEQPGAAPVIVVSHAFWRTRLQGEPVIGRLVRVNDKAATIVGVAPDGFPGLRMDDPQVWLLIHQIDHFNPGLAFLDDWRSHSTHLYGRLRPGVTTTAAKDGLQATIQELARARPAEFQADESLLPYTAREGFRGPRARRELRTLALLVGGLTLVMLMMACANLSNLILSRAVARFRELSVRAALGATRWRLLGQQLVESVLLASGGALGGLLVGKWCAQLVAAQTSLPPYLDFTPDWRMAAAACAVALVAILAVGLVPAWMVSRRDLLAAIKDGSHQTSRGLARSRFRLVLIGSQVAGCCTLLIVAGLMVRGLQRMLKADVGFEFSQVAILDASLSRHGIRGEAARVFWDQVREIVSRTADVERLALASRPPLGSGSNRSIYNDAPGLSVTTMRVEPTFFPLLDIPIIAGRNFEAHDNPRTVVIVSRGLAVAMYGTLEVVGKGFPRSRPSQTIVGVSADVDLFNVTATNVAQQYSPIDRDGYAGVVLLARARDNPERLLSPLRDAARLADGRVLPKTSLSSMQFEERLRPRQIAGGIASLTGALALSLACFGIFGLVAYGVAMRTKEIGIRRALGADTGSVIRLLLRQLAVPVALGMLAGTLAGVAVGRALGGEPFYLPATDATAPAAALMVFALAAAIAALVPATRALGTDPLRALRHD
jgi:predicted permease